MKTKLHFLIIITAFLMSCKKEQHKLPDITLKNYCPEKYQARSTALPDTLHKTDAFPITPTTYIFDYQTKYVLDLPVPNPNNPFEFTFLRKLSENIGLNSELCTYNFCTNELKVVTDIVLYGLDWGVNNWLIFTGPQHQIWKIKPDGTGLTQLTFNSGAPSIRAKWSPNGKMFVYNHFGSLYIADEFGENIESFNVNSEDWCWKDNSTILFTQNQGKIQSLDISNGDIEEVYNANSHGMSPISVDEDNNIYFNDMQGVYSLSSSGQLTQLDTNYFTFLGFQPKPFGKDQLLMLRLISDTSEYENNIVLRSEYLSLFNLNTHEERIINLPE